MVGTEEVMTTEGEESSDEEDLEHIVMDTNDGELFYHNLN